jgi:hypothetical protein
LRIRDILGNRENVVKVSLSDGELAVLDERCGGVPRAVFVRRLLQGLASEPDIATRTEALGLLTELARERRTQAVIALAKELREGSEHDAMRWVLEAQ